jgi:hypothetical protein
VIQATGKPSASARPIAREFGLLQGVLAWLDPRVKKITPRWRTSWDGHNQLALQLFQSHEESLAVRFSRLTSTELIAGIGTKILSKVLEEPDAASILESYITFDKERLM